MKKNSKKFLSVFILSIYVVQGLLPMQLLAAPGDTTTIHLKVVTYDATLFDGDMTVVACDDQNGIGDVTTNAWCAIEQAATLTGWTMSTSSFPGFGIALNAINQYDGSDSNYWLWFYNDTFASVSFNNYLLQNGDEITLVYGTNPMKMTLSPPSFTTGVTSTIAVEEFGFDASWNAAWMPSANSELNFNGTVVTNDTGTYEYMPGTDPTPITVFASKPGFIPTKSITLAPAVPTPPPLPTVNVRFEVHTFDATIFAGDIAVTACDDQMGTGTVSLNAWCAVEQMATVKSWTLASTNSPGFGLFLNALNQYDGSDFNYWLWFKNNALSDVALNNSILTPDDRITLAYGTTPMRLSTAPGIATVGATTTIISEGFGFDSNWMPAWSPAVSSTLIINGEPVYNDTGFYDFVPTSTDPVVIGASKAHHISPDTITLTAVSPTAPQPPTNNNTGGGGTPPAPQFNTGSALNFISAAQQADGSILSSPFYSDWTAFALRAASNNSTEMNKLKQYILTNPSPTGGPNETTDFERRTMALMALGVNPYNGTATNYIDKITARWNGEQFVDQASSTLLLNDDIFALLPLVHAGYTAADPMIWSTAKHLVAHQDANGSWGGVDLTAAAIQALSPLTSIDGVSTALTNAKQFLKNTQAGTGGWGNTDATSWALLAIGSLNEQSSAWSVNGNTPYTYLGSQQMFDGGVGDTNALPQTARTWSTAYAVTAANATSWHTLMTSFDKPTAPATSGPNGSGPVPAPVTPTTTPLMATSTPPIIATSTEPLVLGVKVEAKEEVPEAVPEPAAIIVETSVSNNNSNGSTNTASPEVTIEQETVEGTEAPTTTQETTSGPDTTDTQKMPQASSEAAKIAMGASIVVGSGAGAYLIWKLLGSLL